MIEYVKIYSKEDAKIEHKIPHICDFHPTGEYELKGFDYRTDEQWMDDLFSSVVTGKEVNGKLNKKYTAYKFICECGKTKWVNEE